MFLFSLDSCRFYEHKICAIEAALFLALARRLHTLCRCSTLCSRSTTGAAGSVAIVPRCRSL